MTSQPVSRAAICGVGTLWTQEGSGRKRLIVKGLVLNDSQRPRSVPMLEAQLRSAQGEVLKRWQFDAAAAELQPGASARFRSELRDPPPGAENIRVTFARAGSHADGCASS